MKLLFVVNPISGGVDKEPFLDQASKLCNKYGINFSVFKTTGQDDETNLLQAVQEYKPDKIASVGGDGTTLFTTVTLYHLKCPIGIIPLGSANGMAAELFVNPNPIEALKDIIMSDIIIGLDLVLVNKKYHSIHIGDVGVNANIVQSYENDSKRGMATYAKYFVEELKQLQPFKITVETAQDTITKQGVMMAICNSRKYGTGVPLNITGSPVDGKFEIVIVEKIDANSLIKAGLSRFDDKFHDNQNSTIITCDKAIVEFDEPQLLQLDGEVIDKFKKLEVEVIPGAIPLITHGDADLK